AKGRAEEGESKALAEAGRADREAEEARKALAREAQERERSEKMVWLALQTLNEMFVDVAAERLPRGAPTRPEDERLLRRALVFYQAFARQHSSNPQVQHAVGQAYRRVAAIHQKLGQFAEPAAAPRPAPPTFPPITNPRPL